MKILLVGEYSNLHWTLAQGLKKLGHDVTVASGGDRFKNYQRDINLKRRKGNTFFDKIEFGFRLIKAFYNFKGYDIVQLINPIFLDIKAENNQKAYDYLKKNNKKIFLGAFGTDYFEIKAGLNPETFRYSEFQISGQPTDFAVGHNLIKEWVGTPKEVLNKEIANTCNGIIACLYEYYVSYSKYFSEKLEFIPEPINMEEIIFRQRVVPQKVKFFIGIQKDRTQIKGTDVLYNVLQRVKEKYPQECEIIKAESIPYNQYEKLLDHADVLIDQLYSYTPAMNAFLGMAKGLVVVGGGEPESYHILNEETNKPVINVLPNERDIFEKFEYIIKNKDRIPEWSLKSRQFIEKHHDYVKVAQQYVDFWKSK